MGGCEHTAEALVMARCGGWETDLSMNGLGTRAVPEPEVVALVRPDFTAS